MAAPAVARGKAPADRDRRHAPGHQQIERLTEPAAGDGCDGLSHWTHVDWQRHMRWLRVEDRWLQFIDIGEGPVVLFVHGLSGSWRN